MSRSIRVSMLFFLALAFMATGAVANIPTPELSDVPDCITLSPGPRYIAEGNPIGGFLCGGMARASVTIPPCLSTSNSASER